MSAAHRRAWTTAEDGALVRAVQQYGTMHWGPVASAVGTRTARQCRDRWSTVLKPDISRSPWLPEEDSIVWASAHGGQDADWSGTASRLAEQGHSRTALQVKNRYAVLARAGGPEQPGMRTCHEVNSSSDPASTTAMATTDSAAGVVSAPAPTERPGRDEEGPASTAVRQGIRHWSFPSHGVLSAIHVDGAPSGLLCRATPDGLELLNVERGRWVRATSYTPQEALFS